MAESMRRRTREAIISTSLELFAKRGYSATTTEEIAQKAGISKGLIFNHFPTKQEILFAILDEELDRVMPDFFKDNDPRPAKERFISLINAWLDVIKTRPLLVRLTLQLNFDEAYRKLMKKRGKPYFEATFTRLSRLIKQLGSNKPGLDCFLLMCVFDGIVANYTVAPELFPIDSIRDHLIESLLTGWNTSARRGRTRRSRPIPPPRDRRE
jgi:AcrR family transcriptional regulator